MTWIVGFIVAVSVGTLCGWQGIVGYVAGACMLRLFEMDEERQRERTPPSRTGAHR